MSKFGCHRPKSVVIRNNNTPGTHSVFCACLILVSFNWSRSRSFLVINFTDYHNRNYLFQFSINQAAVLHFNKQQTDVEKCYFRLKKRLAKGKQCSIFIRVSYQQKEYPFIYFPSRSPVSLRSSGATLRELCVIYFASLSVCHLPGCVHGWQRLGKTNTSKNAAHTLDKHSTGTGIFAQFKKIQYLFVYSTCHKLCYLKRYFLLLHSDCCWFCCCCFCPLHIACGLSMWGSFLRGGGSSLMREDGRQRRTYHHGASLERYYQKNLHKIRNYMLFSVG